MEDDGVHLDGPYDRGVLIRTTIGLGAAAAGLTALTYGIAQAIENGSCGVDEYGNVLGAPCPDGSSTESGLS